MDIQMDKLYTCIARIVQDNIWWAECLMKQIICLLYVGYGLYLIFTTFPFTFHPSLRGIGIIIFILERLRNLLKAILLINGRTKIQL